VDISQSEGHRRLYVRSPVSEIVKENEIMFKEHESVQCYL